VQIVAASPKVDALTTGGAHGMMTVSEVLKLLLKGTSLTFYLDGPNTVSVGDPRATSTALQAVHPPASPTTPPAERIAEGGGSSAEVRAPSQVDAPERASAGNSTEENKMSERESFWARLRHFLTGGRGTMRGSDPRPVGGLLVLAGSQLVASVALAQNPNANTAIEEVVVSASRLTTGGFNAPTPTQTLGTDDLEQLAQPNIAASVGMLPALTGNPSPAGGAGNGGTGSGNTGLSQLNLRGLGVFRTLVLVDGQRVAPALTDGSVDVTLLPQLLIKRVDVVTGGVSSSYGSDAMAGVVNFITDTRFTGFKANAQVGVTNYDDDRQGMVQLAWGSTALNDRFHIQASGEFSKNNGVRAPNAGEYGGPDGRTWMNYSRVVSTPTAATPAGQPQFWVFQGAQLQNTFSYGGLITGGPLKGIAFGPGGSTFPFQFGSPCVGSTCVGGDLSANNFGTTASFDAPVRRSVLYTRMSYDITPQTELYGSFSYTRSYVFQQPNAGASQSGLTIQCTNPYLPQSIVSACGNSGITSFSYGVSNLIFPANIGVDTNHAQLRYMLGLNSHDLNLFGKPWTLQAYAELGKTIVNVDIHNMMLIPRYNQAIDAIQQSNGQIVCRSAVAQAAGCIPLDVIGIVPVSAAAWNYIVPANGPYSYTDLTQQVVSAALSGAPLDGWAGPISVAVGAEWRQESYSAAADPYGAGTAQTPYSASYPNDPVLSSSGNNWYAGNFHTGVGLYNVREAFAEFGVPLFDSSAAGKFDLNFAGRETHYSTAGSVFTWKVGGVWDTPVSGVRLRAVRSQDIRAPNLNDLYAPTLVQNNNGIINRQNNQQVTALVITQGNPALTPEIAQNWDAGLVFQPDWANGFRASFDYYSIKINKEIQALTAQQMVDLCQISGNADACQNVTFGSTGGAVIANSVKVQPFNGATTTANGLDLALSYQFDLGRISLPGRLLVSGQASHVLKFEQNPGLPGQPILEAAGANANPFGGGGAGVFGLAPTWKGVLSESWSGSKLTLTLFQRFISDGYVHPGYIECSPGTCPAPTINVPTISNNHLPGAFYWDVAAAYPIAHGQVYAKIDNAFNHNPPALGAPALFDQLGRIYRLGVRFTFE
jgi:outer membrane receptor protein involved in Fe transport